MDARGSFIIPSQKRTGFLVNPASRLNDLLRKTAAEYLGELEKIGILRKKKIGKENLYLNVRLYKLLSG
jgi:Fic family protein